VIAPGFDPIPLDQSQDRFAQKIPTVIDFYIVQPEDIREFPTLNANVRMSFGGYNTREYISEVTEDIHYNYDNGGMSIDSPNNDLVITAAVHHMQKLYILGDVWIQSAGVAGKLKVEFETDVDEIALTVMLYDELRTSHP